MRTRRELEKAVSLANDAMREAGRPVRYQLCKWERQFYVKRRKSKDGYVELTSLTTPGTLKETALEFRDGMVDLDMLGMPEHTEIRARACAVAWNCTVGEAMEYAPSWEVRA